MKTTYDKLDIEDTIKILIKEFEDEELKDSLEEDKFSSDQVTEILEELSLDFPEELDNLLMYKVSEIVDIANTEEIVCPYCGKNNIYNTPHVNENEKYIYGIINGMKVDKQVCEQCYEEIEQVIIKLS